jgi:hypothetical protein
MFRVKARRREELPTKAFRQNIIVFVFFRKLYLYQSVAFQIFQVYSNGGCYGNSHFKDLFIWSCRYWRKVYCIWFRDLRRSGHSWTFEEEEELKQLYDEFKDSEGNYGKDGPTWSVSVCGRKGAELAEGCWAGGGVLSRRGCRVGTVHEAWPSFEEGYIITAWNDYDRALTKQPYPGMVGWSRYLAGVFQSCIN